MRCIVVDDMGAMRRTLLLTLQGLNITDFTEAKNGQDAYELIVASYETPEKAIELAIVDWNMEPVSGLELLNMVRRNKDTKEIIFIMITAEQLQDNVIAAAQAGVDDYIIKPFTPATLKKKFLDVTMRKIVQIRKEIDDSFNDAVPTLDHGDSITWGAVEMDRFKSRLMKLTPLCHWTYFVPLELGRLFLRFKDYRESENWLRKTLAMDFGASEAHGLLSKALREQGKIPESVKELEVAVVESPGSGNLNHKLGEAYLREKNYDRALELLTEAIKIFEQKNDRKQTAKSKNKRGQTKLAKGEEENDENLKEEAVADISDAVELDPELMSAHYNLMVAYKATGRAKEAAEVLKRIQSMEPKDAEGWMALGKAFLDKSESSKVKFAFNKAAELADGRFAVFEEISTALYKHKMYNDAIIFLDKAKEANPSDIFPYNLKGIILRMQDKSEEAIGEYEKAVRLEPDNAGLYYNLGVAYFKSGREKESQDYFRKAKDLDPGSKEMDKYNKKLQI